MRERKTHTQWMRWKRTRGGMAACVCVFRSTGKNEFPLIESVWNMLYDICCAYLWYKTRVTLTGLDILDTNKKYSRIGFITWPHALVGAYFMISQYGKYAIETYIQMKHTYFQLTLRPTQHNTTQWLRWDERMDGWMVDVRLFCVRINIWAIQIFAHFSAECSLVMRSTSYHYTNIMLIVRLHFRTNFSILCMPAQPHTQIFYWISNN